MKLQPFIIFFLILTYGLISCSNETEEDASLLVQRDALLKSNKMIRAQVEELYSHNEALEHLKTRTITFDNCMDSLSAGFLINESSWRLIKSSVSSIRNAIVKIAGTDSSIRCVSVEDSQFQNYYNELVEKQEKKDKVGYELIMETVRARVLLSAFNTVRYWETADENKYKSEFDDSLFTIIEPVFTGDGDDSLHFTLKLGVGLKISQVWLCDYDPVTKAPLGKIDSTSVVVCDNIWGAIKIANAPLGVNTLKGIVRLKKPDGTCESYPFTHQYEVYQ
jgi:hypothetical protein